MEAALATRERGVLDRRDLFKQAGAAGLALSLPAGVLAGCGSSEDSEAGTLSIGATNWLPNDFYVKNSLGATLLAWTQMAWGLVIGSGDGFSFRNGLAANYVASKDGLTHTITLRKGITFHSGKPIDAKAVVAFLNAAFFADDPLHEGSTAYVQTVISLGEPVIVESVDAVDPRTVRIQLSQFRTDIKTALALNPVLDPDILAIKGYGTNVELLGEGGSGPFVLSKFEPGDFAEFTAYPDFFQPVRTKRLRLRAISDPGALALALKGGEIDVASGLAKPDYDSAVSEGLEAVTSQPAVNVDLIFSKFKDEAFSDPRVRKAFALAMDRAAYVERFFSTGTAQQSTQPVVAPGLPGYVEGLKPLPHDPAAARALLRESGTPAPELTISMPTSEAPISSTKGLLEAIAADTAEAGFKVKISILEEAAFYEQLEAGTIEAFVEGPGGDPDPFIIFTLYFSYPEFQPGPLGEYPQIAKDLEAAAATHDVAKRNALLRDIVTTVTEEVLMVPIALVDYSAIARDDVHNFPLSCTQVDSWNGVSVG